MWVNFDDIKIHKQGEIIDLLLMSNNVLFYLIDHEKKLFRGSQRLSKNTGWRVNKKEKK